MSSRYSAEPERNVVSTNFEREFRQSRRLFLRPFSQIRRSIVYFRDNKQTPHVLLLGGAWLVLTTTLLAIGTLSVSSSFSLQSQTSDITIVGFGVLEQLLLAPVYGYLFHVLTHTLRGEQALPNYTRVGPIVRDGLKVSIIATLFVTVPWAIVEALIGSAAGFISLLEIFGPLATTLVSVLAIGFVWYVYPAAVAILARRRRLSDALQITAYKHVFRDRTYAILIAAPILLVQAIRYIAIDVFAYSYLLAFLVLGAGTVSLTLFVLFGLAFFIAQMLNFGLLMAIFYILGRGWPAVAGATGDQKLICDTTRQLRLDAFHLFDR